MNVRDIVLPWSRGHRARHPNTRPEPLGPVVGLQREMTRFFDDVFRGFDSSPLRGTRIGWPSIKMEESDEEYRITAELPGLEERDVEVLVHDGVLSVRGEKRFEKEAGNRTLSERYYGRFERQISLDRNVDESAIEATFDNGVLTVTVPKSAQAAQRSKRIPLIVRGKTH